MQWERNCSSHAIRLSLAHIGAIARRCGGVPWSSVRRSTDQLARVFSVPSWTYRWPESMR